MTAEVVQMACHIAILLGHALTLAWGLVHEDCLHRLLDLGFEKDIEGILKVLGTRDDKQNKRQHVLLSATLNERVEQLAALSLSNPATVGLEHTIPTEESSPREGNNRKIKIRNDAQETERNTADVGPSEGYTEYRIPSQLVQSFLKGTSKTASLLRIQWVDAPTILMSLKFLGGAS